MTEFGGRFPVHAKLITKQNSCEWSNPLKYLWEGDPFSHGRQDNIERKGRKESESQEERKRKIKTKIKK